MTTVSPYHGFPATHQILDRNGKRAFVIQPCYLTPLAARAVLFTANLLAISLMLLGFSFLADHPELSGWLWIVAFSAPWLLRPLLEEFMTIVFRKTKTMMLTELTFEVRGVLGRKIYDRTLGHKFSLVGHDYTQAEKRYHEHVVRQAAQKGKVIAKSPIFGESFHLSYDFLGQRNDVLTVYGQKTALAIVTRLKACDEVLNNQMGGGDGFPTRPEDQWSDQPGDIPEND